MDKLKNVKNYTFLLAITLALRIPIIVMNHIQEDSFITWRVARNFLNYGVIGFNGTEKISASTTHLYVLISTFFQFIFGDHFIKPLLIVSSLVFSIGTILISKILFKENKRNQTLFIILINLIPPALSASVMGMEYGFLFYLYCGLLYYGVYKNYKWALYIFPILILWTRIDTAIFLGISFLIYTFYNKKISFPFVIGGIIGFTTVIAFNYLYFNELINHTITAKKIAYPVRESFSFNSFINILSYYGGFIKKASTATIIIFFIFFILSLYSYSRTILKEQSTKKKCIISILLVFSIVKIFIFVFLKANFDWYYWIPRTFLTIVILYFFITYFIKSKIQLYVLCIVFIGFYFSQIFQSYAVAYIENNQRYEISNFLINKGVTEKESIYLEPAGKIPFYTKMKTYDDVGLVNYEVTEEMKKDFPNFWMNFVKKYNPDYILTIENKPNLSEKKYFKTKDDSIYFHNNYNLIRSFPIGEIHAKAPKILNIIYQIRPLGKDYFIYEKNNNKKDTII